MTYDVKSWAGLDSAAQTKLLQRPAPVSTGITEQVAGIISEVRQSGDAALAKFGKKFDGVSPDPLKVAPVSLATSANACSLEFLNALDNASYRIKKFHAEGLPTQTQIETAPGLICTSKYLPISPVGLYVPGGSAPLVSTVMMLAIPAVLAGCSEIVMCTPPSESGSVHPALLHAAYLCGVKNLYAVGGAQAIAAMAYGTESVPKCAKIFGPGNSWVSEAKQQVSCDPEGAAQDLPAGPSEVLVIADASADPVSVCWDLLSQAEHGPDSQALLLSNSTDLLNKVAGQIGEMASTLPRASILEQSLKCLRLINVPTLTEAISISNRYAPEHLILNCQGAIELAEGVTSAGSVFIGPWTPESLGDYCSGTNHVLPTFGYARAYGGLSVVDFMRRMTTQIATPEGLANAGPDAMALAVVEGLDAHRMAVEYRLSQS
jgi:histidinol dehydrogenase